MESCQGRTCRVYLLGHLIYQISLGPKYGVGLIPTRAMECEQVHRSDQEWLHIFIRAGFDPIWAVIYSISYHCVCIEYAWCILYIQCLVDRFGVSARVYSLSVQRTEYVNNMMGDLCQSILCTKYKEIGFTLLLLLYSLRSTEKYDKPKTSMWIRRCNLQLSMIINFC